MAFSINDIAEELGISASTVSRVVNNKSYVNENTRQMVLEALEKRDYTPNVIARRLQAKDTKTVGIIIPDITETFFGNIIQAATAVIEQYGYNILLCDSNESAGKQEQYLKYLFEQRVSAIIIALVRDSETLDKYMKNKIPVVLIDNIFKYWENTDSVVIDNVTAGEMGTDHLIACGCRNIGIICGKKEEYTGHTRLEGYMKSMQKHLYAIHDESILFGDFKEDSGYELMNELLKRGAVDGVFITSSKMTFGAIKAIRDNGKKYPEDIKIVGFDIYDPYEIIYPGVTSVVQPNREIAEKSAELLLRRINAYREGEKCEIKKVILNPSLVIKDSSGL